jgi:hypothetical protein
MNAILESRAIAKFMERGEPYMHACGCLGVVPIDRNLPLNSFEWPHDVKLTPVCSCAMGWVVEVEDQYFKISKEATATGYNYTAKHIGPIGGPYKIDEYGRWI